MCPTCKGKGLVKSEVQELPKTVGGLRRWLERFSDDLEVYGWDDGSILVLNTETDVEHCYDSDEEA